MATTRSIERTENKKFRLPALRVSSIVHPLPQAVLLVGLVFAAVAIGNVELPLEVILHDALHQLGLADAPTSLAPTDSYILWSVRLPRAFGALLAGGSLALGGAALQSLFRNPLAEPGLVGISAGATLGAVVVIILGSVLFPTLWETLGSYFLPVFAFAGAAATAFIVYRVARAGGNTQTATLLLAGIAVQALVFAVVGFLLTIGSDAQVRSVTFWSLGSLKSSDWETVYILTPIVALTAAALLRLVRPLNLLLLGEAEAAHLGVRVERLKIGVILLVTFSVGATVAFFGVIGFVGLVVPHLLRLLAGPDLRRLMPSAVVLGANLLLVSDIIARSVSVSELPVGVITSAIGAPFFLWLLMRYRKLQTL